MSELGSSHQTPTPDLILQLASGYMGSKLLFVANELGLFEKLGEGWATVSELAQRAAIPVRTMRIVADAMVALGLVERQGDRYQNSIPAETFLSGKYPSDLRPFLRFWNHISYLRFTKLDEAVRTGDSPWGEFNLTPELQKIFSEGVGAVTSGSAHGLATNYDFGRHSHVLDLGGGTGSFLKIILARHPNLKGTLFEAPATAAVARQGLVDSSLKEKIQIVEGDFFKDPIPPNHDAVILANVLHIFSPERNVELLRRVRNAVLSSARILLVDFWTNPTHTAPVLATLLAAEFLVNAGTGDVYSVDEATQWLKESGWKPIEHKPLGGPASVIVAETA